MSAISPIGAIQTSGIQPIFGTSFAPAASRASALTNSLTTDTVTLSSQSMLLAAALIPGNNVTQAGALSVATASTDTLRSSSLSNLNPSSLSQSGINNLGQAFAFSSLLSGSVTGLFGNPLFDVLRPTSAGSGQNSILGFLNSAIGNLTPGQTTTQNTAIAAFTAASASGSPSSTLSVVA